MGTPRLVSRRGGWSAKGKAGLCSHLLGTALGPSTCSISGIPSKHPPREQGLGLKKQRLRREGQLAQGHRSQDPAGQTVEEEGSAGKPEWAEMLMLGRKASDECKS